MIQPQTDLVLVQSGMVQSGMVQSGMVQSGMVQSGMVQSGMVQSGMVQSGMVWCKGVVRRAWPWRGNPNAATAITHPRRQITPWFRSIANKTQERDAGLFLVLCVMFVGASGAKLKRRHRRSIHREETEESGGETEQAAAPLARPHAGGRERVEHPQRHFTISVRARARGRR
uniref:Uncharacterized protein n=1 Tax=Knipowitschia caucasica TaxID=637954 RepID=A0AAV2KHY8_KNICA